MWFLSRRRRRKIYTHWLPIENVFHQLLCSRARAITVACRRWIDPEGACAGDDERRGASLSRQHRGDDSYRLLLLWTPPGVSTVGSSGTVARGGQRRERSSGKTTREARLSPGERTVRREKEVVDAWPGGRMGSGNDSLT